MPFLSTGSSTRQTRRLVTRTDRSRKKAAAVNSYTTARPSVAFRRSQGRNCTWRFKRQKSCARLTESLPQCSLRGVALLMSSTHKKQPYDWGCHSSKTSAPRVKERFFLFKGQRQSLIARCFRWPGLQALRNGMNIVCKLKLSYRVEDGHWEECFPSKTAVDTSVCTCVLCVRAHMQEKVEDAWVSDTFFPTKICYFIL